MVGYPWAAGGSLYAEDLNSAVVKLNYFSGIIPTAAGWNSVTPTSLGNILDGDSTIGATEGTVVTGGSGNIAIDLGSVFVTCLVYYNFNCYNITNPGTVKIQVGSDNIIWKDVYSITSPETSTNYQGWFSYPKTRYIRFWAIAPATGFQFLTVYEVLPLTQKG